MSPRQLLAVALCTLLIQSSGRAGPKTRTISGVVETSDGTRLPKVDIRITNVGSRPTSDAGEFTIPLPEQFEPGTEVEFYVAGWVINSPVGGKTWVPKSETATIHIVVIRRDGVLRSRSNNAHAKNAESARRLQH